ncbi:MAG: SipW-dependent-type signal peptide-containing protein [Haloplanus sp.]
MTEFDISRRKALAALGTIGVASAGAGLGTSAYFSDQETFQNNQLTAGTLDMKVSWDEHYYDGSAGGQYTHAPQSGETANLVLPSPTTEGMDIELVVDDVTAFQDATRQEQVPSGGFQDGQDPCSVLADVPDDLPQPVVDLQDVKPGDFGEVTFDFSLCDNPGYVWLNGALRSQSENGITEPEADDPDEDGTPTAENDGNVAGGWPLAALAAVPALGGDDEEADDGSDRRSALRKGVAAAGAATAGLGALTGTAAAEKPSSPDPDGANDVSIDNGTLSVSVGELASGTTIDGNDWFFEGTGTLYRETYGFQDGTSATHQDAENMGSVDSPFPSSVSPGTTAESTVEFPSFQNANGDSTPLSVDRRVTLDPNEPTLRVEYEVTNTGSASIDDLRISQYVDYDISNISTDIGRYYFDSTTQCEYISQEDTSTGLFSGFTGEQVSTRHSLTEWPTGRDQFFSGDPAYNGADRHPPGSGTGDVELTFEWSLGSLAGGESTTFRNSFVYNETEADFQRELCQESPGQPTQGVVELADALQVRMWYDGGDNFLQDDEEVFFTGSLRDALDALSSGNGLPLDGDGGDDFDETGDDPAAATRGCYTATDDVHNVGFQWWLPLDHGNEVQSDSVTFDLGFYTEQCRHNDGAGMNNAAVNNDEIDG